jgi:NodT family efflux transporter outer membrane factor (OMF) lipoprotein
MKTILAAPLFSLTAIVLTGCMVGPNYVKPSTPTAPAFKELAPPPAQANDGWKLAQPGDQTPRGNWWEIYSDPQLNALEAQIASANQTLKIAEANYRQARTAIRFNRSYEAPTIGVAPSISAVRDSANQPYFPAGLANNGEGDFALPVDLSWEIDLWGRIRRSVTAAREQTQASAADMAAVQLSLQADLAYDYFELRSADAEERLLDETVQAYSKALGLTENRFVGGAAPRSDVAQARTQLEDAQVLDTDIMVERAEYEHAIAVLIGKPPANFSLPPSPIDLRTPAIPAIPQVLPSQLLERRPDIAAGERRMAAANEQIGIAQAAYYPSLNLSALAGFEGTSALNWFNWPSRFWAVGPSFSETLFDAGRRRATKEAAVAAYDGNVANYRQTTLTAFQ